jgi:hypothetical protein
MSTGFCPIWAAELSNISPRKMLLTASKIVDDYGM